MRKYYIVAKKNPVNLGHITITLTSTEPKEGNGYQYLMEIEAPSYAEACKLVRFEKNINGGSQSV